MDNKLAATTRARPANRKRLQLPQFLLGSQTAPPTLTTFFERIRVLAKLATLQYSSPEASQSLLNQLGGTNLEDPPEATPGEDADAARFCSLYQGPHRGVIIKWKLGKC